MGEFGPCLLDRSSGLFCVLVSRGIRTRKGGSKFLAECSLAPHDFLWRFQGREALANPTLGRGGWAVRPRRSACLAPLGSLPRPEESRGGLSGVGCYTEEGEEARLQRLRVSSFFFSFLTCQGGIRIGGKCPRWAPEIQLPGQKSGGCCAAGPGALRHPRGARSLDHSETWARF